MKLIKRLIFSLQRSLPNKEVLYKSILTKNPNQWVDGENRPSSAAFKDSKGVSVDRKGWRKDKAIVKGFQKRFDNTAIVSLTVGKCRELDTYPVYDRNPTNIYHCLILKDKDTVKLTDSIAGKLSRNTNIVWVSE